MPRQFFVTSGRACSPISELNAFDQALKNARIAQCNLVSVSSVLPKGCKQTEHVTIPVGTITYAVIARMDGQEGENIGAAISWTFDKKEKYGIVAETHGYMEKEALLELAEWKIKEMAKIREIKNEKINNKIQTLRIPMDNYGCVIVALVFLPEP
jgi:arginine decarboxylase